MSDADPTHVCFRKSLGERERIAHALTRMEATITAMRIALNQPAIPIGLEATQAMQMTANEIATHVARADAYLQFAINDTD